MLLGLMSRRKRFFYSLKNIAQLPPSPLKEGGRVADFAAGTAENLVAKEAERNPLDADTGE